MICFWLLLVAIHWFYVIIHYKRWWIVVRRLHNLSTVSWIVVNLVIRLVLTCDLITATLFSWILLFLSGRWDRGWNWFTKRSSNSYRCKLLFRLLRSRDTCRLWHRICSSSLSSSWEYTCEFSWGSKVSCVSRYKALFERPFYFNISTIKLQTI